ncbi:MAG: YceD family protein [bacterium]
MKIVVSEIRDEGQDVHFDGEIVFDVPDSQSVPVNSKMRVMKEGDSVYITGTIRTTFGLRCSRCLNTATTSMDFNFSVLYQPVLSGEKDTHHELKREELEAGFYGHDEIDIADMLREQITVNLPIKPLCTETCKGMCSVCGANLNSEACSCKKQETDERWNALNKFFIERKN